MRVFALRILFVVLATILAHLIAFLVLVKQSSPLVRYFRRDMSANENQGADSSLIAHLVWATYVVTTRLPYLDKCVVRSLTAMSLFRIFGLPARVHIGVRKAQGAIEAHMWLSDFKGKILCDDVSDLDSYEELIGDDDELFFS